MSGREEEQIVRWRVVYTGRVQGVGFRYTALDISRRFAVVGYVRNMLDGAVELEAEGAPQQVELFLQAIASAFERHIRDDHRTRLEPLECEREFDIRF